MTGLPLVARFLDVAQRNGVPDFVAALRVDQPWGSAQLSGAVHESRSASTTRTGARNVHQHRRAGVPPGAFLTPFGANTAGAGFLSPLAVGAPCVDLPAAGASRGCSRPAGSRDLAAASSALNRAARAGVRTTSTAGRSRAV